MRPAILDARFWLRLGDFLLDADFRCGDGFHALFGPSGSGKTTTLRCLAGLQKPDNGKVTLRQGLLFDDATASYVAARERGIGLVFQDGRLFPHLRVYENLRLALAATPPAKQRFTFEDIVTLVDCKSLLQRWPQNLSGGERQRVALARALLASPDFLLLDEPVAALDLPERLRLLHELREIQRQLRLPMICVTHDAAMVLSFADAVFMMQDGKLRDAKPVYELSLPGHHDAVAVHNVFEVQAVSHDEDQATTQVAVDNQHLVLPRVDSKIGDRLLLSLPASDILLAKNVRPHGLSAQNILSATITEAHTIGNRYIVTVDAGITLRVSLIAGASQRQRFAPGTDVQVIIKATAFRVLDRPT